MQASRRPLVGPLILVLLFAACTQGACTQAAAPIPAAAPPTATPAAPTAAPAADAAPTAVPRTYAITDVTLIDVERGAAVPGQTVTIVGDRIDRAGAQDQFPIPPGAEVIAGHGLYLMPGLVDAHVHYQDAPVFGRVLIANGVLLVRDMGMPNDYILKLRDDLNAGKALGPEMVAAGVILDADPPIIPIVSVGIKTPEAGRAAVRAQRAAGADMIKVYSKLDKAVFVAILDEAQQVGLKVVGHVPDTIYVEGAAKAGLRSIEHWFGFERVVATLRGEYVSFTFRGLGADIDELLRLDEVDPQALQDFYGRLRATGVTVDPTIATYKNWPNVDALDLQALNHGEYVSRAVFAMWKAQWAGQTEIPDPLWQAWAQMVKGMNQAGIPLMVGTDLDCPGVIPGYSVHDEMAIWQAAGIPPADVLRSATLVPVRFMGLGERLGSITSGKRASLVLLRANPLADVQNAEQIESVFLRGQYFSRVDLDRLLEEAKGLAGHE